MSAYLSLAAGLVLLIVGGEILVRGAVRTAERLGVSPLLIGLTLVGFGTSAPEMVISVQAAMSGSPGIAIGNFVGSSISNIFLILGLTAILSSDQLAEQPALGLGVIPGRLARGPAGCLGGESSAALVPVEDGEVVEVKGNEEIVYDGEVHTAANLYDALKEGYYGKL